MKAEGVLAGVADLFLAYPNGKYAGLFIEMKTEDGRQQPTQKEFEEKIKAAGYEYALCHSFEEFTITVNDYLNDEYYNGESDYYTTTAR